MSRDMNFFMNEEFEQEHEIEIQGITRFRYPQDDVENIPPKYKKNDIIPWILKPITTKALEKISSNNTSKKMIKGRIVSNVDSARVTAQMMVETIVFPNFKDPNWLSTKGILDPVELLMDVLKLPGDFNRISNAACDVNGIQNNLTEDDLIESAKN